MVSALRGAQLLVLIVLLGGASGTAVAQTAPAPPADRVELVELNIVRPPPQSPPGTVRFEITLNYQLETRPGGFIHFYLFENGAQSTTQDNAAGFRVSAGADKVEADVDFEPAPHITNVRLAFGLYAEDRTLLAVVQSETIGVAAARSRVAFDEAMAARQAGDNQQSLQSLTRAVELAPGNGVLYYWRGDTFNRLSRYDEAIADFTRAIELMPQDNSSRLGRGVAFLWKGEPAAAIPDLTFAIQNGDRRDPVTAWAHRARGLCRVALGQPNEAIADFQVYLALQAEAPDRAEVEGWIAGLR